MFEQDDQLQCEQTLKCIYNNHTSRYEGEIHLINTSLFTLYFKIVSTFASYLEADLFSNQIQPKEKINFQIRIKSTNIISKDKQFVVLYFSKRKISQKIVSHLTREKTIHLRFDGEFEEDEGVFAIIDEDVNSLCATAKKELNEGKVNQALQKYEEAFQLHRSVPAAIYGLAQCYLSVGKLEKALMSIETSLILGNGEEFLLVKCQILYKMYEKSTQKCGYDILKECERIMKEIHFDDKNKNLFERYLQLQKLVEQKVHNCQISTKLKQLMENIEIQAYQKYSAHQPLQKYYPTLNAFQQSLSKILNASLNEEQTPDYVIDPISYEIMNAPLMVPHGTSYQQKTLQQYFSKQGYKDPMSRIQLRPEWLVPNNNLFEFIQNHPKLSEWKKYEHQASKYH